MTETMEKSVTQTAKPIINDTVEKKSFEIDNSSINAETIGEYLHLMKRGLFTNETLESIKCERDNTKNDKIDIIDTDILPTITHTKCAQVIEGRRQSMPIARISQELMGINTLHPLNKNLSFSAHFLDTEGRGLTPHITPCTSVSSLVSDMDDSLEFLNLEGLTIEQRDEQRDLYMRIEQFLTSLDSTSQDEIDTTYND